MHLINQPHLCQGNNIGALIETQRHTRPHYHSTADTQCASIGIKVKYLK